MCAISVHNGIKKERTLSIHHVHLVLCSLLALTPHNLYHSRSISLSKFYSRSHRTRNQTKRNGLIKSNELHKYLKQQIKTAEEKKKRKKLVIRQQFDNAMLTSHYKIAALDARSLSLSPFVEVIKPHIVTYTVRQTIVFDCD